MIRTLEEQGIHISAVYYCPHHPKAQVEKYRVDCECRKPKLGMYEQAVRDFDLEPGKCAAVGDRLRDCSVCGPFGCRGFLVGATESEDVILEVKNGGINNIEYQPDLKQAAEVLVRS